MTGCGPSTTCPPRPGTSHPLRVAFLGEPPAGWPERLRAAGHTLTVGGPEAVTEAAEGADIVLSLLPDERAVRLAYTELARTASPGQVFADLSAVSEATTRFCALALPAFLAVSIGPDGRLSVRGEPAHFARAQPVLAACAPRVELAGQG